MHRKNAATRFNCEIYFEIHLLGILKPIECFISIFCENIELIRLNGRIPNTYIYKILCIIAIDFHAIEIKMIEMFKLKCELNEKHISIMLLIFFLVRFDSIRFNAIALCVAIAKNQFERNKMKRIEWHIFRCYHCS